MVPEGADAVVRVEDTDAGTATVAVRVAVEAGKDIRRSGEDIVAGETVLRAGAEVGPAEAGVLASVGLTEVACTARPRVTVLTTGDELQEPGEPLRPGGIRNSNAHSIAALVERSGASLLAAEIVADDLEATERALKLALVGDLTVICGGVSVGEHDHVRPALAGLGVEQVFWRVALRPGAPTYFGVAPSGALAFGLPGNPVSAMVTFLLFVRPAIGAMLGAAVQRPRATAAAGHRAPGAAHPDAARALPARAPRRWLARASDQGPGLARAHLDARRRRARDRPAGGPALPAGTRLEIELLP